jgi:putative transcriptional regulator
MAIIVNLDVMLAKRKMSVTELSERVGITMANLSILKNGKAKAIRLSTLDAICRALDCQPGDILEYRPDAGGDEGGVGGSDGEDGEDVPGLSGDGSRDNGGL